LSAYPGNHLHFAIDGGWDANFQVGPKQGTEIESESNGIMVLMDLSSAQRARGATIDWVEDVQGEGLKLDLPGAPAPVEQMTAAELQERMNSGERLTVIDTRGADDRAAKPLDFAEPLDADLMARLKEGDVAMPLVFVCNVGEGSQQYAEHYRKQGYLQVYNLAGGAEAILG